LSRSRLPPGVVLVLGLVGAVVIIIDATKVFATSLDSLSFLSIVRGVRTAVRFFRLHRSPQVFLS